MEWLAFFDWEHEAFNMDRTYLAQIAREIRALRVDPSKVHVQDFFIETQKPEQETDGLDVETKTAFSKAMWGAMVGVHIQ